MMGHFSTLLNGLASLSIKKGRNRCGDDIGRDITEEMAKEAKKNGSMLRSSGVVHVQGSNSFSSVFTRRGEKGVNQDCLIVWEEFGCQEDMTFCGMFDGHGPWGHFVAKQVRKSMPMALLCKWQDTLALASLDPDFDWESDKNLNRFDVWKKSYIKTCAAVDQELEECREIDTFHSGTTALTIVKQVWDVISNQEAVDIVSSTPDRGKAAKNLVQCAVRAWKRKRRGIAMDDISAICIFFHCPTFSHKIDSS
ncbi:hypothetical protein Syun_007975 [Stephania yunnanensis]|uniref:PPM-type phosphatase domain-containing protein n=1 Tax=Stephania yunnanensis TaxID=152371 RepID=A0AAP0Q0R8_9MAGN